MATTVITRPWQPDDLPFLWDMLYESIHVRDGDVPPPRSILEEPGLAHYLVGFGRDGDDAQIAVEDRGAVDIDVTRIGAAWCRRTTTDDPGYGFVDEHTPELGIAVITEWRGRGVGTRLIEELIDRNPAMSLSVDDQNDAARLLYERLGFVDVGGEGTARTMLRRAAPNRRPE
jgi:ribosomal protein S18 acetylase RimI-like enzyme